MLAYPERRPRCVKMHFDCRETGRHQGDDLRFCSSHAVTMSSKVDCCKRPVQGSKDTHKQFCEMLFDLHFSPPFEYYDTQMIFKGAACLVIQACSVQDWAPPLKSTAPHVRVTSQDVPHQAERERNHQLRCGLSQQVRNNGQQDASLRPFKRGGIQSSFALSTGPSSNHTQTS